LRDENEGNTNASDNITWRRFVFKDGHSSA
jgi:hypothetical protein